MKVQKRNGKIIDFDANKISKAIILAMEDTLVGVDEDLATEISGDVVKEVASEIVSVDTIQDMVELHLMSSDRKDVAKAYILYREKRDRERQPKKKPGILSEEFLAKYKHQNPFPTQLGQFVYYRTYSRWLPDKNRREQWWETVRRAVEYNCSLIPGVTKAEAEALYDNVFNLRLFLSGRTLWTGGTEVSAKFPSSSFNCAFTVVDSFSSFVDLFYLLMVGTGCGIRVLPEDVSKLPKVRTNAEIIHSAYQPVAKKERVDFTTLSFPATNIAKITVGDSKEGWKNSLKYYFELLTASEYAGINTIVINYDNVRPKGERLQTFGGKASGHSSLQNMYKKIDRVIKGYNAPRSKLRPIDCIDIANIIGENVTVGGIRRTSEICLVSPEDTDSINAKQKLYEFIDGEYKVNESLLHRQMSNNSIYYTEKPTREQLHAQLEKIKLSGEPGFVNAEAAKKRRKDFHGVNPCFTGDMKLKTGEGYERFDVLAKQGEGKEKGLCRVVNHLGLATDGKVWYTGVKETVEVAFENGTKIKCTPDHQFMLYTGKLCKAENLAGKKVLRYRMDTPVKVLSVTPNGKAKVYDFTEPSAHLGVVEGIIVHNCAEVLLADKGTCNLTSLNVAAFVKDGVLDMEYLLAAQVLSARAGYRMTNVEMELHDWDYVQRRDRLTGCSLMGWQDLVNMLGLSKAKEKEILSSLRYTAKTAAEAYADEAGLPKPLLTTVQKPEGSLAQLPTVSSGIHYQHSEYFIRRVRISATDPLVKVAEELGWIVENEVGQTDENCTIKVISFPVKAPAGRNKYDVTAIEQLENYKMFMENYVEQNTSITVSVKEHEWEDVEQWLWDNWDEVIAVSFLNLDNSFYQLMPYEKISREKYLEMSSSIKPFTPSLLSKYETEEIELDVGDEGCETGVCPIR